MNKKQKLQLIEAKKEFLLYLMDEASDEEILELIDCANQFNGTEIDISLFEDELSDKGSLEFGEIEEDGEEDDDYIDENSSKEDLLEYLTHFSKTDVKKIISYLNNNYEIKISAKGTDEYELIENLKDDEVDQEMLWEAIDNVFPDDEDDEE